MAFEVPGLTKTFTATGDLSSAQYKFVKFSSGNVIVATAITDVCIGILQNKPDATGKPAIVMIDGISKVQANAALSQGDIVGTSTDGQAQAVASTNKSYGTMLDAPGAASSLGSVMFDCKTQNIVA